MRYSLELRSFIDAIESSDFYEGDYGDCISDVESILKGVDALDRSGVPAEYLRFLAEFGFGELDSAFYVDDGPVKYASISDRNVEGGEGLYVFAGNSSDLLYAFDAKNSWRIVAVSAESDEVEVVSEDFSDFILDKIRYVKELVGWRENN
ncbi:SMI1/KNR4 family protein [Pseudomonas soli]|uniref:SMI1/KNR4 family protein n=1 Tax=Pseudomonas soli TaxID=1306993 RepID=UPI0009DD555B|nr:SMI1/KNR4 family protein [Pseudomonas soli]PYC36084.1 SMI1/KNR4 family protein [Pseudomonas soli]